MSWKREWVYLTGNVTVTVEALDERGKVQTFTFECFVSDKVNAYNRLDGLSEVARVLSNLRNLYHVEVIDIEKSSKRCDLPKAQ
jgi:hypothetical protein